jgi:hypothetical protein
MTSPSLITKEKSRQLPTIMTILLSRVLAKSYVFAIVVGIILHDLRSAAVGAAAWRERPSD